MKEYFEKLHKKHLGEIFVEHLMGSRRIGYFKLHWINIVAKICKGWKITKK